MEVKVMDYNSTFTFIINNTTKQEVIIDRKGCRCISEDDDTDFKMNSSSNGDSCEDIEYQNGGFLPRSVSVAYSDCGESPGRQRFYSENNIVLGEKHDNFGAFVCHGTRKRCASLKAVKCRGPAVINSPEECLKREYELVNDGWVAEKEFYKNKLNLDAQIQDIIETSCTAEVSLGNITLTF